MLGMSPAALIGDWQTFGFLFENLCIRDLLVYARSLLDIGIEPVRYYRDDSGLECDAIIELSDDKLLRNTSARTREPEFLAVLVGVGEFAYQRDDGVYVIPVGVLGA